LWFSFTKWRSDALSSPRNDEQAFPRREAKSPFLCPPCSFSLGSERRAPFGESKSPPSFHTLFFLKGVSGSVPMKARRQQDPLSPFSRVFSSLCGGSQQNFLFFFGKSCPPPFSSMSRAAFSRGPRQSPFFFGPLPASSFYDLDASFPCKRPWYKTFFPFLSIFANPSSGSLPSGLPLKRPPFGQDGMRFLEKFVSY